MGTERVAHSHLARPSLRCPIGFFIFTELKAQPREVEIYLFIAIGRISKCPRPTPDCSRQNVGNKHLVAAVLHEEMEQEPDWYN